MNTNYQKAVGYAYHLDHSLAKDIVHDAFTKWFDKTGKNLFDEHERTVISVVKKTWWTNYFGPSRIVYKGKKYPKRNRQFSEDGYLSPKSARWLMGRTTLYQSVTPEDEYIAKEFDEWFRNCDNQTHLEIYLHAVEGYKPIEISKILGLSPQLVSYYFKKMRYTYSLFN